MALWLDFCRCVSRWSFCCQLLFMELPVSPSVQSGGRYMPPKIDFNFMRSKLVLPPSLSFCFPSLHFLCSSILHICAIMALLACVHVSLSLDSVSTSHPHVSATLPCHSATTHRSKPHLLSSHICSIHVSIITHCFFAFQDSLFPVVSLPFLFFFPAV